jgi:hypothetical protein
MDSRVFKSAWQTVSRQTLSEKEYLPFGKRNYSLLRYQRRWLLIWLLLLLLLLQDNLLMLLLHRLLILLEKILLLLRHYGRRPAATVVGVGQRAVVQVQHDTATAGNIVGRRAGLCHAVHPQRLSIQLDGHLAHFLPVLFKNVLDVILDLRPGLGWLLRRRRRWWWWRLGVLLLLGLLPVRLQRRALMLGRWMWQASMLKWTHMLLVTRLLLMLLRHRHVVLYNLLLH